MVSIMSICLFLLKLVSITIILCIWCSSLSSLNMDRYISSTMKTYGTLSIIKTTIFIIALKILKWKTTVIHFNSIQFNFAFALRQKTHIYNNK